MKRIFYPESIVVIGVSERPDNLAKNIVANLISFGFAGPIYAVGRSEGVVHGIKIQASLEPIPDEVGLAVILTPSQLVPNFVRRCGEKGITRVIVESGGFSEFSEAGAKLEAELLEIAQSYQIRLVGPNCISVVNLESGVCLPFGIISPSRFTLGDASIISQSGGVSLTLMGMLSSAGVGVNKAVSIGNKADLDETDFIEYYLSDEGTRMLCLYLESISDGRKLLNLAVNSKKPIIIHKANRSRSSQEVAFSHTAALANDDRIVDAAFKQSGILRADDFEDIQWMAKGLSLPPVKGNDLVIISRSGGHAVTAADLAERHGFNLPPLPTSYSNAVRDMFRADVISPTNPLDLGVVFDFDIYAQIVQGSLTALSPDAVLLINTYGLQENENGLRLARRVGEIIREQNMPIAICLYADGADPAQVQEYAGYPIYNDIDAALRGLASSREWYRWITENKRAGFPSENVVVTKGGHDQTLSIRESLQLCQEIGIPTAKARLSSTVDEIVIAGENIGYPIALKIVSTEHTHKTDAGGVVLDISNREELEKYAGQMVDRFNPDPAEDSSVSFLVQEMVHGGVELLIGGKHDPTFGAVISLGIGGIHVEIYDDVSFRIAPISRTDALEMIGELRGNRILDGYRGGPAVDRQAITDALVSVSQYIVENPEVVEFEVNPLIATTDGAIAVDARVRKRVAE